MAPASPSGVTPILSLPRIGDFGWTCAGSGSHLSYTMAYEGRTATERVTVANGESTIHREHFQPGRTLRISGPLPDAVSWRIEQNTEAFDLHVFVHATFPSSVGTCAEPRLLMRRYETR